MADTGGSLEGDHGNTATSFSQLLFSDDVVLSLDMDQTFTNYSCYPTPAFSAHEKSPRMLCFGNHQDGEVVVYGETTTTTARSTPQKSGVTSSDSSSASSGNNSSVNATRSKSCKKRIMSTQQLVLVHCSSSMTTTPVASQRTSKKTKADNKPSLTGHAKVRKEKLGERITALQQLVSPFGKTDTASVLHEAMGYIRFLHDQVQVLCSPYLQHHLPDGANGGDEETSKDLKSRGLCLVPLACTVHVAGSNGADLWSPPKVNNVTSSTLTKQLQQ